jgi:acetoin utilization deacetylase AcuC-like enzyme
MNAEEHWYNYNLQMGSGDEMFAWAIDDVVKRAAEYEPDVVLLATGADGHESEYWGMKYTYEGYNYAAKKVAGLADKFLIGGAGGYQPYTHTPRIWANVVKDIVDAKS